MKRAILLLALIAPMAGCGNRDSEVEIQRKELLRQTFKLGYQKGIGACLNSLLTNNLRVSVYAITNDEPINNP